MYGREKRPLYEWWYGVARMFIRAAIAIAVTGFLYAAYLWIWGKQIDLEPVLLIVTVPILLTILKLLQHKQAQ